MSLVDLVVKEGYWLKMTRLSLRHRRAGSGRLGGGDRREAVLKPTGRYSQHPSPDATHAGETEI